MIRNHMHIAAAAAVGLSIAVDAVARDIVFDFDTDGDPTTIENEVSAEVGDVVIGYMVLTDFPARYDYFWGMQFGLDISSGLELLSWQPVLPRGAVMNDGVDGVAVALQTPYSRFFLPQFAMQLVLRVTDPGPQSVSIRESRGWSHPFDHVLFYVSETPDVDSGVLIESPATPMEQLRLWVNRATPTENTTWGAIKKLFEDDTL